MVKRLIIICLCLLLIGKAFTQDYFGNPTPDNVPKIFAHGFICKDNQIEGRGSFSPDGKEFYYTVSDINFQKQKIFFTVFKDNKWSNPDTASFSKEYANWEPFFSNDGQRLYFTSNKNNDSLGNHKDFYFVNRAGDSWSNPEIVQQPINSKYTDLFFSQVRSGNVYFCSERPKGKGLCDIYIATIQTNGIYQVKNIGSPINHRFFNWDPCIAPDESFIIFSSVRLLKFFRKADLYITYRDGDRWTKPKSLGKLVNTNNNEYAPFLSPDNKYLFFSRLGDGVNGDIYWVDLREIVKFKNK